MPTYWKAKSEGYELVDGSSSIYSSSSSLHSLLDDDDLSRRGKASPASSWASSKTPLFIRRNRRKVTLIILLLVGFFTLESMLGVILSPPAYVVLQPESYVDTLEATVRDRIPLQSLDARQAILTNLKELKHPSSSLQSVSAESEPPASLIPDTIFSSDLHPPPSNWALMWKEKGFKAKFYNDEEANAWVEREWKGTDIVKAWKLMPRSILRADLLRYLLLLIEGGTWSDMDTVPLKHFSNWTEDTTPYLRNKYSGRLEQASSAAASIRRFKDSNLNETVTSQPIRAVISLECIPKWSSLRGILELLRLMRLNRHRNMQFVQWTIHMGPHHPILIDVLRRILETMDLYQAYKVEAGRESRRAGWGWKETQEGSSQSSSLSKKIVRTAAPFAPWESIGQQWVYTRGHWRLGWHPTSVEEWTGPGVWTDAVVSYIYATNGIRPEQLAKIKRPTQIGDLVILPEFGFNPPRASASDPYKVSRVVHLFRGSWKHQVSKQVSKQ